MKRFLNQKGQVAVEYVLITVVLFGVFLAVRNIVLGTNMLKNYVQQPWQVVAGMIETGVWGSPQEVRAKHPGLLSRHNSFKGDD